VLNRGKGRIELDIRAYRITIEPKLAAEWLREGAIGDFPVPRKRERFIENEIKVGRRAMPLIIIDARGNIVEGQRLLKKIAKEGLPRNCWLIEGARPARID
jgi:hypothetical protein